MAEKVSKAALWCRGKVGREHTPVTTRKGRFLGGAGSCMQVGSAYACVHHIECEVCGRVLKFEWQMGKDDCPDGVIE